MRAWIWLAFMLLLPASARADDRAVWAVDLSTSMVVLGGARETGGFMPTISASRAWCPSGQWSLVAGAEAGVFGFGDEARWIGVLAGPVARVELKPAGWPLVMGLGLHGSLGRVPVCNDWGLCLRFIGVYPAADLALRIESEHLRGGVALAVRYVDTLAWTGASVEPSGYVGAAW